MAESIKFDLAQKITTLEKAIREATKLNQELASSLENISASERDRPITAPKFTDIRPSTDQAAIDTALKELQKLPPIQPIPLPRPFNLIIGTNNADLLIGTALNDIVLGRAGGDLIFGLAGDDILSGEADNDYVFGGKGKDLLLGGTGEDFLNGEEGDDQLFGDGDNDNLYGSIGDDLLDGGDGSDTADYSTLNQAITLERAGIVNKGKAGIDQILNIETIIGASGKANAIDGSTGTSGVTSFSVDLATNRLTVNNIPGLGSQKFTVKNFRNVIATSNSDFIRGDSNANKLSGDGAKDTIYGNLGNDNVSGGAGDDFLAGGDFPLIAIDPITPIDPIFLSEAEASSTVELAPVLPKPNPIPFPRFDGNDEVSGDSGNDNILGGTGNDVLDGGVDNDTANYTFLPGPITLLPQGEVDKGKFGKDQLLNIEKIIGPGGSSASKNAIDGSIPGGGPASFEVDLSANELIVKGIPGQGDVPFDVFNFNSVRGTAKSDEITGNNGANILTGANVVDPNLDGVEDQDNLTGLGGSDGFLLGDSNNAYYLGGKSPSGREDFATITDFATGVDTIQLKKGLDYIFGGSNSIWLDKGVNDVLDSQDDLIAFVNGTGFNLNSGDLIFV